MTRAWEAEIQVEPEEALRKISEQFPLIHAIKIKLLGVGWDNTAYLINDKIVFRFPRRNIAIPLLKHEACMLPKIAPLLPLPIPFPKYIGQPLFVGHELVLGKTACTAGLSNQERSNLAAPLAKFLKALHTIPVKLGNDCQLPCENGMKLDYKTLIPKIQKNLEELILLGLIENKEFAFAPTYKTPEIMAIVHGDFYVRHILVNEEKELAGAIDWGDIHLGDIAVDIAIAHSFLPISSHTIFRKAYGDISEETWLLASLRALYSSTLLAIYGHHTADKDISREGLWGIRSLRDSF